MLTCVVCFKGEVLCFNNCLIERVFACLFNEDEFIMEWSKRILQKNVNV